MAKFKPVRVEKTKYGTYSLHYYSPDGTRRRSSVGSDEQYAQRIRVKYDDWLMEGKDPERELERAKQEEQAKSINLRDFYPVFMDRHGRTVSRSMQIRFKVMIDNICRCRELSLVPLPSIKKRLVLDYMQKRIDRDGVCPATVNREASFLRNMLNRAVEWETLDQNPLSGLRMLKESEKREVDITPEEVEELLELLPDALANIAEFAVYTGMRRENILSMRIEDIGTTDIGSKGRVTLKLKGGRRKIFPLGSLAMEVVNRAKGARAEGFLFTNPVTNDRYHSINKTYGRAVKKLGLKVFETALRFHDLRHVFSTWLYQEGVPEEVRGLLLGHADNSVTDRYTTYNLQHCASALEKLPRIRKPAA